jgi:hypothetical protein
MKRKILNEINIFIGSFNRITKTQKRKGKVAELVYQTKYRANVSTSKIKLT